MNNIVDCHITGMTRNQLEEAAWKILGMTPPSLGMPAAKSRYSSYRASIKQKIICLQGRPVEAWTNQFLP